MDVLEYSEKVNIIKYIREILMEFDLSEEMTFEQIKDDFMNMSTYEQIQTVVDFYNALLKIKDATI